MNGHYCDKVPNLERVSAIWDRVLLLVRLLGGNDSLLES